MVAAKPIIAAIGNFDGVHLGHQALLRETVKIAQREGAIAGVIVFEPHPRQYFQPDAQPFLLTSSSGRDALLRSHGAEVILKIPFDAALAKTQPIDFVRDVLIKRMGVHGVVAGSDFRFGVDRQGDAALLKKMADGSAFFAEIVDLVSDAAQGEKFGSTAIRTAIKNGDMVGAARMLGHSWSVQGCVMQGQKLGRTLGFPTANMTLGDYIAPRHGVYAVRAMHDGKHFDGVANYGRRPTVGAEAPLLEVHLFDFSGDLYGLQINVEFIDFIRDEQKFDGLDSLKAQIAKDIKSAKLILRGD